MTALTKEGPDKDEVRIIGVELAITDDNGREQELEMFACSRTMPRQMSWGRRRQIRVTLHTSDGDITLRESSYQL